MRWRGQAAEERGGYRPQWAWQWVQGTHSSWTLRGKSKATVIHFPAVSQSDMHHQKHQLNFFTVVINWDRILPCLTTGNSVSQGYFSFFTPEAGDQYSTAFITILRCVRKYKNKKKKCMQTGLRILYVLIMHLFSRCAINRFIRWSDTFLRIEPKLFKILHWQYGRYACNDVHDKHLN